MAQLAQSPPGRLPLLWPGPASPLLAPSSLCPGPPLASAAASRQPDLRVLASGLPCTCGLPSPHKGPPSLARALPPGVLLLAGPLGPHTQPSTERPTPSTTLRAQESTSHIFLTSPPPIKSLLPSRPVHLAPGWDLSCAWKPPVYTWRLCPHQPADAGGDPSPVSSTGASPEAGTGPAAPRSPAGPCLLAVGDPAGPWHPHSIPAPGPFCHTQLLGSEDSSLQDQGQPRLKDSPPTTRGAPNSGPCPHPTPSLTGGGTPEEGTWEQPCLSPVGPPTSQCWHCSRPCMVGGAPGRRLGRRPGGRCARAPRQA